MGVVSTCDPGGENVVSNHTCGCPKDGCPADHNNATLVLHTLLAVMSMGPVVSITAVLSHVAAFPHPLLLCRRWVSSYAIAD